jgi:hypothetical protein
LKFDLVVAMFPNLVVNDYKSHVVKNGLVTFWLISTNDGSWELFFQLCDITKVTIVNNVVVIRISKQKKIFTYFWVTH